MLLAHASCARLNGYLESITVLSFPCLVISTSHSISSFLGIRTSGTSLCLANVTFCRNDLAAAAIPGVTSTTVACSASTGANVDHGVPVAQCATASAVDAAVGREAPSAADTSGGRDTVSDAGATAYSPSPPPVCHADE
nr:unnamed protein product [Digitaria exilis]